MCKFDNPDCFNCPYEDCTADAKDIQRQWAHGCKEVYIPERIIPSVKAVALTYTDSQRKYFASEKGKAAQKKYDQTDKGRERWRRYYARKKALANGER